MLFRYKATKGGKEIEGTADAVDRFDLARQLRAKGISVISAEKASNESKSLWGKINEKFSTVGAKDKIFFINNLSEMLRAGLTLTRALTVYGKQTKNPKMARITKDLTTKIDSGENFAGSLKGYPDVFPKTTVAMVEAGETSGKLPESLKVVGGQLEKSYQLKKRIRGAMIYPAIVLVAMILVAVLMLVYIVPTLSSTFEELGAELPLSTQLIIGFSEFITGHWIIALLIFIFGLLGLYELWQLSAVKRAYYWVLIRLPVIGAITKKANSATMARTLASLLSSGVEIVDSLHITKEVIANPYFAEVVGEAAEVVPKGENLSVIFSRPDVVKLYPPFVGEMMSVGEETGKLGEMLDRLATFYENEVDAVVKDLSTIIEPLIMLMVGAGVGFFALSMIQPIYQVGNSI